MKVDPQATLREPQMYSRRKPLPDTMLYDHQALSSSTRGTEIWAGGIGNVSDIKVRMIFDDLQKSILYCA